MSWGVYGILIVFGAFILLIVLNPNLSCFGRRIKSPFYPLLRKRRTQKKAAERRLHPSDRPAGQAATEGRRTPADKAEDYGFHLD